MNFWHVLQIIFQSYMNGGSTKTHHPQVVVCEYASGPGDYYYAVKNTSLDPIESHVYFPDNDIPVYNAYLLIVNSCQ